MKTTAYLVAVISALAVAAAAPAPEPAAAPAPAPAPGDDSRPEIIEIIAPAANAQETLATLNLGAPGSELGERNKRTIGILRQLFPQLTQIIEQKVQQITSFVLQTFGPVFLRAFLGNRNGGGGGNTGGGSGTVELDDDDDDDDDEPAVAFSSTTTSTTTTETPALRTNEDKIDDNIEVTNDQDYKDVETKDENNTDVDTKGEYNMDVETKSEYNMDVETKGEDNKDVETKDQDYKDVETKDEDNKDVETKDQDYKDVETKDEDNKDVETKDQDYKDIETKDENEQKDEGEQKTEDERKRRKRALYFLPAGVGVGDENQLLSGAESQQAEVRVAFGDGAAAAPDLQAAGSEDQAANSATLDEITLEDTDDTEENRNKRFLSFGGSGGSGGSGGGSGNFLFDIVRQAPAAMARAAGSAFRLFAGTDSLNVGLTASHVASLDPNDPQLVAGSSSGSSSDSGAGDGDDAGAAKGDNLTEGVPGPITRLFIIANRGIANLIQDLILRIAQTSERIVNFKARLITSII